MSKKSHKVGEPAAPYPAKSPTAKTSVSAPTADASAPATRYAKPEDVRKAADKVFKAHEELFRKLAQ